MTLSEFIQKCNAWSNGKDYKVEIILYNGQPSVLTVVNCNNEFDAKERCFLYLTNLIEERKKL